MVVSCLMVGRKSGGVQGTTPDAILRSISAMVIIFFAGAATWDSTAGPAPSLLRPSRPAIVAIEPAKAAGHARQLELHTRCRAPQPTQETSLKKLTPFPASFNLHWPFSQTHARAHETTLLLVARCAQCVDVIALVEGPSGGQSVWEVKLRPREITQLANYSHWQVHDSVLHWPWTVGHIVDVVLGQFQIEARAQWRCERSLSNRFT